MVVRPSVRRRRWYRGLRNPVPWGTIGKILHKVNPRFSFHSFPIRSSELQQKERKIEIMDDSTLSSPSLSRYLAFRNIPYEIVSHFCRELRDQIDSKTDHAIGFKNESEGYQICNRLPIKVIKKVWIVFRQTAGSGHSPSSENEIISSANAGDVTFLRLIARAFFALVPSSPCVFLVGM